MNSLVADLQQDGFVMGGITTYSVVSSKMWSFELCVSGESVVTGRLHHFYGNRRSLWWYLTTASWSNPACTQTVSPWHSSISKVISKDPESIQADSAAESAVFSRGLLPCTRETPR
jgi:hypothetical protein